MAVQIDQVHSDVHVQPPPASTPGTHSGLNGIDRTALERLRPLVLQILKEELERLRRQQG
jgi:hypothetical protein